MDKLQPYLAFFFTLLSTLVQFLPSHLHLYSILVMFYPILFQLSISQSALFIMPELCSWVGAVCVCCLCV